MSGFIDRWRERRRLDAERAADDAVRHLEEWGWSNDRRQHAREAEHIARRILRAAKLNAKLPDVPRSRFNTNVAYVLDSELPPHLLAALRELYDEEWRLLDV